MSRVVRFGLKFQYNSIAKVNFTIHWSLNFNSVAETSDLSREIPCTFGTLPWRRRWQSWTRSSLNSSHSSLPALPFQPPSTLASSARAPDPEPARAFVASPPLPLRPRSLRSCLRLIDESVKLDGRLARSFRRLVRSAFALARRAVSCRVSAARAAFAFFRLIWRGLVAEPVWRGSLLAE